MKYSDFEDSPAGRLVPTVYDARAFVPNPLPPTLDINEFAFEWVAAGTAMGELRGACRKLQNPYMLIRPLQRLEAQTTSAMEGTFTTADALARTEAGLEPNPSSDDIEAANFTKALSFATEALATLPISGRLLKQAHLKLLEGVNQIRGRDAHPGEYARDQNMIGGYRIESTRFVPPPPRDSIDAMADLERFINREDAPPAQALLDIALVHYQFETIHPFADGNGRLGRMLITLMAMTRGQLDLPVLYMSPELESRKDEYIDLMYNVSAKGAWGDWMRFFLSVMGESCARTTRTIDAIIALQADHHGRLRAKSRSMNAAIVLDALFDSPFVDASQVSRIASVTDAGARNILRQLVDIGILVALDHYPRLWYAPEILRVSDPRSMTA